MRFSKPVLLCALLLVTHLDFAPARAETDVLERLKALPGVEATETTTATDTDQGLRRFTLHIEQPVDHFDASARTFKQKLVLFHRGYHEPMVLQTSGYAIFSERLSRVARDFETNQIQVEHRFFAGSVPASRDWTKLTVRQSAEDFHRVVRTFKELYKGRWVNTGASKGGMTSTYHRRFFPDDLDGTVADVAPLSFGTEDPRYVEFVDTVGGEKYAQCRADLEALQAALLRRRGEILPSIEGQFTALGGKETAYEHAVIEVPFVFWQYGEPESAQTGCAAIPPAEAPAEKLTRFLKAVNDPSGYDDTSIETFQPYYYQAAAELGAPASKLIHLAELLLHPYTLAQYLPGGLPVPYSDATMRDVRDWAANEAERVMWVYGELDPWTAAAYRDIRPGADNHWFMVAGGNHGANYALLSDKDYARAIDAIGRWLDKPLPAQKAEAYGPALEDVELAILRRLRR